MQRPLWLVVLLLVLVAAGCYGGTDGAEADTTPLSSAELGWIRAYSAWTIETYGDESDLKSGQIAVESCVGALERVGPPPSERLEPSAPITASVCPLLAQPGTRRRARDLIDQADRVILPYLRDEQAVALESGVTDDSHADVALSEVASEFVGRPVEVRCWTDADWITVVEEDNAWNDESDDPDDLVGWASDDQDRIQLVLEVCNEIARVQEGAGDVGDWDTDDQIEAADSVETLAHEIGHLLADANEATVECRAIRLLPKLSQRFGVSAEVAASLAELYRSEVYPTLDDEYTAGGCPRTATR